MNQQQVLDKIRGKRNELRMTQEEIALRLGMTQKTYNLKENGKTEFTLEELLCIMSIFGWKFSDIFLS